MLFIRIFIGALFIFLAWNGISRYSNSSDFQDYYSASQLFLHGEDIYAFEDIQNLRKSINRIEDLFKPELAPYLDKLMNQTGSYIYPPTFAFLLIPIAILDYPIAAFLFSTINFLSLLASFYIIYRFFKDKVDDKTLHMGLLLGFMLTFRFLENHVNNNQVGFFLILLILASIQTKHNMLSGLLLSLAIIIKLTPALFLVYFFWKKRWSVIPFTFIFLVFWFILPGIFFWDENLRSWANWDKMILQSVMQTPLFRAWKNNQSMIATLAKYFLAMADPINQSTYKMPWILLQPDTVVKIFNGIFIFFGLALLHLLYKTRIIATYASDGRVISALFLLSVIFSGISWIHTFCFFLFPMIYLSLEFLDGGMSHIQKNWFLFSSFLLLIPNRNILGANAESLLMMVSILLYAGISFFFLIVYYQEEN
jgi:hypothetical protein